MCLVPLIGNYFKISLFTFVSESSDWSLQMYIEMYPHSVYLAYNDLFLLLFKYVTSFFLSSGRAKKLDEHLNKLNNYLDTMTPKKQYRNELLANDRSTSSNSKMGTQMQRSPSELVAHKFEDGPKNIVLNKRLRTSIAETRVSVTCGSTFYLSSIFCSKIFHFLNNI